MGASPSGRSSTGSWCSSPGSNLRAVPTLLLVRHAQGSFGGADYDVLSDRGREQAAALADDLEAREVNVTRVLAGSLARQRDTAAPIAERFGRDLEVDPRWNEYESEEIIASHASPSLFEGTQREFQALLDEALAGWVTQAGGSWPAFRDRVGDALGELAGSLTSGETALVSTSGGPIAAIAVTLLGLPPEGFVALNRVAVNAGVTKVVTGASGATLVSFNEHAYLERPGRSLLTYR
jgi:broad specificity phosphatase PhoE